MNTVSTLNHRIRPLVGPKRLGWGVLGCGWLAQDFAAPAIVDSENGQLIAACDPDRHALQELLGAWGDPQTLAYEETAALLANPAVEAVYLAMPQELHADLVEQCAQAGKHVLCQRPMAGEIDHAERMVAACHHAGVVYATAFDQRFHPAHARLRQLVRGGRLGTLTQVRMNYGGWLGPDWSPELNLTDPDWNGRGALRDLAPHGLDLLEMLVDRPLVDLAVLTQQRIHGPYDDGAALIGRFADGTLASLQVAYNCPERYPRHSLELVGTDAMAIAIDTFGMTPGGQLWLIDGHDGRREPVAFDSGGRLPFVAQVEAFAQAVLQREPFPFCPQQDVRRLSLLLEASQP